MAQGEKTMQCLQLEKKSVEESITTTFKGLHDVLHSHEVALLAKSEEISLGKAASLSLQQEELRKVRDKIANVYQMVLTAVQNIFTCRNAVDKKNNERKTARPFKAVL